LIEFSQRCDLVFLEKGRMKLKFKQGNGELLLSGGNAFLFKDNKVFKVTSKLEDSNMEEVSKSMETQKNKKDVEFNSKVFDILKKDLGEFEVVL